MRLPYACAALIGAAIGGGAAAQPAPRGPDGFRNNCPHPDKIGETRRLEKTTAR